MANKILSFLCLIVVGSLPVACANLAQDHPCSAVSNVVGGCTGFTPISYTINDGAPQDPLVTPLPSPLKNIIPQNQITTNVNGQQCSVSIAPYMNFTGTASTNSSNQLVITTMQGNQKYTITYGC